MRLSALIPRRRPDRRRLAIRFLLTENPVRGLGEMPRDRADGGGVAAAPRHPLVQSADMTPGQPPPRDADRVGRFHICPLQIAIDVRPEPPVPRLAATGV